MFPETLFGGCRLGEWCGQSSSENSEKASFLRARHSYSRTVSTGHRKRRRSLELRTIKSSRCRTAISKTRDEVVAGLDHGRGLAPVTCSLWNQPFSAAGLRLNGTLEKLENLIPVANHLSLKTPLFLASALND